MRRKTFTLLLSMAFVYVLASVNMPLFKSLKKKHAAGSLATKDSLFPDSTKANAVDTTKMDSLQLAIYRHNKQIDDSIRLDSLNRQRSTGIEAPVVFSAEDSMIYDAQRKTAHLFGSSSVKYTAMDLKSEKIYMSLDSDIVHATGRLRTLQGQNCRALRSSRWGRTPMRATRWLSISRRRRA